MYAKVGEPVPTPRAGVDNVFFALKPESALAGQAIAVQTKYLPQFGHNPYLVPPGCLHVSLLDIGIPKNLSKRSFETTIALAKEAAGKFQMEPFEVVFEQALSFNPKAAQKPFVLRMGEGRDQVATLCKSLNLLLAAASVGSENKAANPHMTLARTANVIPLTEVAPIRWVATTLVLVLSVVGKTKHYSLHSWPLHL